jgi:hypothetical protein
MLWTYIQAAIRHGLTSAGGALVAHGYATSNDVTTVIGAIMTVIGFAISCFVKWRAAKAAATSTSASVPVKILFLVAIAAGSFALAGCGSTPQRVAYVAAGTTVVTVDAAMSEWGAYVAIKHPGTNQELAVKSAYEKYQASMAVVTDAGAAYAATGGTNSTATAALNQAIANSSQDLTDLETLITTFGVTLK